MKKIFTILILMFLVLTSFHFSYAQQETSHVKGKMTNEKGESSLGVTIRLKDTKHLALQIPMYNKHY